MNTDSGAHGVHSFDEWSELQEVVVGRADHFAAVQLDNSFSLMYWSNVRPHLSANNYFRDDQGKPAWPYAPLDRHLIDETVEDIEGFAGTLASAGIRVRRPSELTGEHRIQTPFWESMQTPPLNIRDQTIILGDCIVETAPQVRARLFENNYLKPLFYEYFTAGAQWHVMPQPTLAAGGLDFDRPDLTSTELAIMADHHSATLARLPHEIALDGAQCIRLGRDVLVNVGNKNHALGYKWLQSILGDRFQFHALDRLAADHIDTFILPLRPGLWLARNADFVKSLPDEFASWDVIVAPEAEEDRFPNYAGTSFPIASTHVDMNVLSINESTVVVNSLYPELIRVLERRGLAVVPVQLRHRRLIGGGFHCLTIDVRRSGNLESYT